MSEALTGKPNRDLATKGNRPLYAGSENKLNQIMDHLSRLGESPILIQGVIGVGKSTLLEAVRNALAEGCWDWQDDRQCFVFDIQAASIPDKSHFAREIWDGLMRVTWEKLGTIPSGLQSFVFSSENSDQSFLGYLDQFKAHFPNDTFLFVIDQFEQIFDSNSTGGVGRDILGLMMAIKSYCAPRSNRFLLSFLLSSRRRLPVLYSSGLKPLVIPMGPLARPDFYLLCQTWSQRYEIADSCIDWLYDYTYGFPRFARILMNGINQPIVSDGVTFDCFARQVIENLRSDPELEEWYESLEEEEKYVLIWLTVHDGVLADTAFRALTGTRKTAANELVTDRYLVRSDEGYRLQVCFLSEWLSSWNKLYEEADRLGISIPEMENKKEFQRPISEKGICINELTQEVFVDGVKVTDEIPNQPYRALICLARRPGQWVLTEDLIIYVYELDQEAEADKFYDQSIKTTISRLRKSLGNGEGYLKTKSKVGYCLENVTWITT